MRVALTVAGSDSSGGAGIQADLKTFTAMGVYGMSVITAVTAQNTLGVRAIAELSPAIVGQQFDAVCEDIPPHAAKTGMLASGTLVRLVAEKARAWRLANLVVDPVMVATSGDSLAAGDAVDALRDVLLPLAQVVTPNLPEAEALVGRRLPGDEDVRRAAETLGALGARHVVIKGGHRETADAVDLHYDSAAKTFHTYTAPRVRTRHTHGTGCTFAAAIAAGLAQGLAPPEAIARAKAFTTGALRHHPRLGHGHGPLNHMWQQPLPEAAGPST